MPECFVCQDKTEHQSQIVGKDLCPKHTHQVANKSAEISKQLQREHKIKVLAYIDQLRREEETSRRQIALELEEPSNEN
jgi:hypothetical protein